MDWAKTTARRDAKQLIFGIWCVLYQRFGGKSRNLVVLVSHAIQWDYSTVMYTSYQFPSLQFLFKYQETHTGRALSHPVVARHKSTLPNPFINSTERIPNIMWGKNPRIELELSLKKLEMRLYFYISHFHTPINGKHLQHFMWNCSQINATRPPEWFVSIDSGNCLVKPGNKLLPGPKLAQI